MIEECSRFIIGSWSILRLWVTPGFNPLRAVAMWPHPWNNNPFPGCHQCPNMGAPLGQHLGAPQCGHPQCGSPQYGGCGPPMHAMGPQGVQCNPPTTWIPSGQGWTPPGMTGTPNINTGATNHRHQWHPQVIHLWFKEYLPLFLSLFNKEFKYNLTIVHFCADHRYLSNRESNKDQHRVKNKQLMIQLLLNLFQNKVQSYRPLSLRWNKGCKRLWPKSWRQSLNPLKQPCPTSRTQLQLHLCRDLQHLQEHQHQCLWGLLQSSLERKKLPDRQGLRLHEEDHTLQDLGAMHVQWDLQLEHTPEAQEVEAPLKDISQKHIDLAYLTGENKALIANIPTLLQDIETVLDTMNTQDIVKEKMTQATEHHRENCLIPSIKGPMLWNKVLHSLKAGDKCIQILRQQCLPDLMKKKVMLTLDIKMTDPINLLLWDQDHVPKQNQDHTDHSTHLRAFTYILEIATNHQKQDMLLLKGNHPSRKQNQPRWPFHQLTPWNNLTGIDPLKKENHLNLVKKIWWPFPRLSHWKKIGRFQFKKPSMIQQEPRLLVRSQVLKSNWAPPSARRPMNNLLQSWKNRIQLHQGKCWATWRQSLLSLGRWTGDKLRAPIPSLSPIPWALGFLSPQTSKAGNLSRTMTPMYTIFCMVLQTKELLWFWLRSWSDLETLPSTRIWHNVDTLHMDTIQPEKLQPRRFLLHPASKNYLEKFSKLAKVFCQSSSVAFSRAGINTWPNRQEAMMRFNDFVENMGQPEEEKNTWWQGQNALQFMEWWSPTRMPLRYHITIAIRENNKRNNFSMSRPFTWTNQIQWLGINNCNNCNNLMTSTHVIAGYV